jgi:hypothetical protein
LVFDIVPIITALIGLAGGSIITGLVTDWRTSKRERLAIHENLIHKIFLQLQDAAESLWSRFDNLSALYSTILTVIVILGLIGTLALAPTAIAFANCRASFR